MSYSSMTYPISFNYDPYIRIVVKKDCVYGMDGEKDVKQEIKIISDPDEIKSMYVKYRFMRGKESYVTPAIFYIKGEWRLYNILSGDAFTFIQNIVLDNEDFFYEECRLNFNHALERVQWILSEDKIVENVKIACTYIKNVLRRDKEYRWDKLEEKLIKDKDLDGMLNYMIACHYSLENFEIFDKIAQEKGFKSMKGYCQSKNSLESIPSSEFAPF